MEMMINFRKLEYESEEKPAQVFSMVTWTTEKVNNISWQLLNDTTMSTNKLWIGELHEEKLEFVLIEPRRDIFFKKIFYVVVRGKITPYMSGSLIYISVRLGWFSLLVMFAIYLGTILLIYSAITNPSTMDLTGILLWLLAFTGFTLLLIKKLNKTEKRIENLFGIHT